MLSKKVLIADKHKTGEHLTHRLRRMGIQVRSDELLPVVIKSAVDWWPEVVVIETQTLDASCLELCRQLRAAGYCGMVIVHAEQSVSIDIVLAHEAGADDCISRASEPVVLDAKIRRAMQRRNDCLDCRSCVTRGVLGSRTVLADTIPDSLTRELTRLEELLLSKLLAAGTDIVSQHLLLHAGWGARGRCTRLLHDAISRLRDKLRPIGWTVTNVRGLGYRLDRPNEPSSSTHCCAMTPESEPNAASEQMYRSAGEVGYARDFC